ncbi:fumarylacetoacetate hydrolase domain-containing protein 2 isoform X1 [Plutella xylostella]|uniref:fumarylacetoacetate hydrolase domain-containing protein 2 isoform X1 n=1 Tax=Plutella xylostella TaxID=51655 RepID=UPI00203268C8|nr:fumarylacetoacetate hydrolase domain-containing protein 2 isoform X1 [Plutella xylostella]
MASTSRLVRQAITPIKTFSWLSGSPTRYTAWNPVRSFSVSQSRDMKFVQFTYAEKPADVRVGYLEGDNVVDLNKVDSSISSTLLDILRKGQLDKVQKVKSSNPASTPLSSVKLQAPIHGMDKVLCIGLNYKDHCEEQNLTPPPVPMFFSKFSSTVIGPSDAVQLRSDVTKCVDWEVELVVVIGKKASNVQAREAYDYVFGYTVAQDISARDWQKNKNGGQFLLGKSMDTFCPIGPCIATADEVGDPQKLNIRCSVNGVVKQSSNTEQLVHKIPDAIERLTSVMTLLPGDIILTGTPGGVGMYRDPPEYLLPGHVVESEVEKIGVLTTRVEGFRVCANK